MSGLLEITILGCGSSGGVPRADGEWGACNPANPKNHRSRCSLLVRRKGAGAEHETTVVVDTSPDFRLQSAGAGVKRGLSYGTTDDYGYYAQENPVSVYDLHATVLHLLGLDHKRLTFYHNGIRRRLTDVHGEVVKGVLA